MSYYKAALLYIIHFNNTNAFYMRKRYKDNNYVCNNINNYI